MLQVIIEKLYGPSYAHSSFFNDINLAEVNDFIRDNMVSERGISRDSIELRFASNIQSPVCAIYFSQFNCISRIPDGNFFLCVFRTFGIQ